MRRIVVVGIALVTLWARDAFPCTISMEPGAVVFGPSAITARGHRPWIRLSNVKATDKVTLALATPCEPNKVCSADRKPIAIERAGDFVRPKELLSSGSRILLFSNGKPLETFEVTRAEVKELPAWAGMTKPTASMGGEGLCAPSGPIVKSKVLPTTADLSDAVLLVYTQKPDARRPLGKLAAIYSLAVGELELRNGLGTSWLDKKPKRLWTALADGDGNIGPIVEHAFDMRAEVLGPKDRADPRGTRPFIRLYGAKGAVSIRTVDAACDPSAVCAPTMTAAVERTGDYVRPLTPLANGARVQVVAGTTVIADFTVRTGPGKTLPVVPFSLGASIGSSPNMCPTPNMVAPDLDSIDTDATVILLYATKPDPAKPLAKLATILRFDGHWLDFGAFGLGKCLFKKLPRKLWTVLATDDGAMGEAVEHDLQPPPTGLL